MSQSVMATLRQCAGPCFRLLQNPENKPWFPLAEWFADPDKRGFIFLNTTARQREALLRVMAVFIDILCQLNLSLADDPNRRFFYLIDEWASLPAMSAMTRLIHEGRSKGASMLLFFQSVFQAIAAYGESTAQSIIDAASTYVIFRANDSKTADYWSRNLGQTESAFTEASLSAGYRQHDSESYRDVRHIETAVLPSEIQNLEKLHCFIKMQNLPVTLGSLQYEHYPRLHPGFVASDFYKLRTGERPDAVVGTNQNRKTDDPQKPPPSSTPGKTKEFGIDNFDF
jgi:type IV secretory pathway TraG/TraD family ATPase VirD4